MAIQPMSSIPASFDPLLESPQSLTRDEKGKSPGVDPDADRKTTQVAFTATARPIPEPLSLPDNTSSARSETPKRTDAPNPDRSLLDEVADEVGEAASAVKEAFQSAVSGFFGGDSKEEQEESNRPSPRDKKADPEMEGGGFSLSGIFERAGSFVGSLTDGVRSYGSTILIGLAIGIVVGVAVDKLTD